MASATIKIFLAYGDPKRLRTAELSIGQARLLQALEVNSKAF
jgi:hypothetical protein